MKKFSVKTILIILFSIFTCLSMTMLIVGALGLNHVVTFMNESSCIALVSAGVVLLTFIVSLIVIKFILFFKFKNLSDEEVNQYVSSSENYPTKLALYILLNPTKAKKQGFVFNDLRLA